MIVPYIVIPSVFGGEPFAEYSASDFVALFPGTPDVLEISAGSWTDETGVVYQFPDIVLQCLADSVRVKRIITTEIPGREGTVKQFVATGDWSLTFTGILLTGDDGAYPEDRMSDLMALERARVPVEATSQYLARLGITQIVITDIRVPQRPGGANLQEYQITALSDTPFELILEE